MRAIFTGALVAVASLALTSWSAAHAVPILYGVNSADDGLSIIDPLTGAVTFVGALSPGSGPNQFPVPTSLAGHPHTGVLYTWNNQAGLNGLVSIDLATGEGTLVAPDAPSPNKNFGSMAFAPDGTLYGVSGGLFEIDLVSSQITEIHPNNFLPDMAGAAFGPDGLLYGSTSNGTLFLDIDLADASWQQSVDLVLEDGSRFGFGVAQTQSIVFTPSGQLIGSAYIFATQEETFYEYSHELGLVLLDGEPPGQSGSAVDPATGFTYFFTEDGVILLSTDPSGSLVPQGDTLVDTVEIPARDVLFDIDPVSGIVSNFRDLDGPTPQGLAFVPEPWAAVLLGFGLLGVAVRWRRSALRQGE